MTERPFVRRQLFYTILYLDYDYSQIIVLFRGPHKFIESTIIKLKNIFFTFLNILRYLVPRGRRRGFCFSFLPNGSFFNTSNSKFSNMSARNNYLQYGARLFL